MKYLKRETKENKDIDDLVLEEFYNDFEVRETTIKNMKLDSNLPEDREVIKGIQESIEDEDEE